jgi:hypothetical protein
MATDPSSILSSEIARLRSWSYDDLLARPPYEDKSIECGRTHKTVAIWTEQAGSEVRVVVQLYTPRALGTGTMEVGGFAVTQAGVVRDLTREDLYPYT